MAFARAHSREIIAAILILFLYFFTRLYHILDLPIFTDEAIYVRWSQIAEQDAAWRFISLTDGKQPSFVWIAMIIMKFVADSLLSGRLVSVLAGFLTTVGIFFLGREVFKNTRIGLLSSLLYVLYPFSLVYDRMALYDSLVSAFSVWALFLSILLVRRLRLDVSFMLGVVIGGGVLTKSNAFFSIYLLPFTLLLFDWKQKFRGLRLAKWVGLVSFAAIFAYGFYSIQRLSPFFHIIDEKNALFIYPFSEWKEHPFRFFVGNLKGLFDWLLIYLTIPGFLLVFISFFVDKKYIREKILFLFWFSIPFVATALFGKTLYPRFILFMTMPLLVLFAYSLDAILERAKNIVPKIVISVLFVILMVRADYFVLFDISYAPIPFLDLEQYSNSWPSGGGIKEAVVFFENEARNKKIFIGTQGTFGLMPYSFEIYLVDNPNVKIMGFWPMDRTIPKELQEASKKVPTYVVFYQPCHICEMAQAPKTWPVKLIKSYQKGNGPWHLWVYQVL